ncbi:MAG: YidH family protein [Nitrososphaerota archaeon]
MPDQPDTPDTPDTTSDEATARASTPSPSATRDLLANERTLLAWARTAVAIMGLGFVVARFGLLIRELANLGTRPVPSGLSTAFGVVLVICGMALLILSWLRYRLVTDDILHNRFRWDSRLGALLTGLLVLAGILLAIYLLITA